MSTGSCHCCACARMIRDPPPVEPSLGAGLVVRAARGQGTVTHALVPLYLARPAVAPGPLPREDSRGASPGATCVGRAVGGLVPGQGHLAMGWELPTHSNRPLT